VSRIAARFVVMIYHRSEDGGNRAPIAGDLDISTAACESAATHLQV